MVRLDGLVSVCLILLAGISLSHMLLPAASGFSTVEGQPVLDAGQGWDGSFVWRGAVIYNGTSFVMWYGGEDIQPPFGDNIGLATSADGVSWTRFAGNPVSPVGPPGSWGSGSVYEPWVIREGGGYKLWYAGEQSDARTGVTSVSIGYATSPEGIHWTPYPGNPVLKAGSNGQFDDGSVNLPSVISTGSGYLMYYNGYSKEQQSNQMGLAKSPDGIHWTKSGTVTIPTAANGWDGYGFQRIGGVMRSGGLLIAAYTGQPDVNTPSLIGFATSTDGVNWTPYSGNPVIASGNKDWDRKGVLAPMAVTVGGNYFVYYTGLDGNNIPTIGLIQLPISAYPIPEYPSTGVLVLAIMSLTIAFTATRKRKARSGL